MSSLLSAELAATCNALGYYDEKSNKYYADSNTLETVKDLIRYLRRDDDSHDIRRQLGETKVLQTDLLPLLKSYWEETDLFDVLLRLLVNLTTPALMLWNEEIPTDTKSRNHYLQIEDHLKSYKHAFADETFWAVLSTRLSKILETDYSERGDENSLIIERILILVRNILYVAPDPNTERRTDNDASIHDQVLWALHQSGMLDIILYITTSINEKAYYMHILEILSFMLREQRASELAQAAVQRSETEKIRDEAELLAIRHRETNQRQQKVKMYNGARHSRFGGTYVLKSMKSISDNELIYHKPLNKLDALNFDVDKKKPKTPKNRLPVQSSTFERRSAFSIRLFLKEFCVEFLNGAYNTLMHHVKDNLVRARAQAHDESYYLWALRFFMEFNRCYKFEVKLVSQTLSGDIFRYVQQLMENYFDLIQTDKKKFVLWSRRLHLALLAYRELLYTICVMDKSPDQSVRDSAKVIKSKIFYILEYREFIVTLLITYDELKMSDLYLKDLMETQHVFLRMLESFCKAQGTIIVQKKSTKRRKKKRATQRAALPPPDLNLEDLWDEAAPQLSAVLEGNIGIPEDVVPFDAASDSPIDEQKSEAMKNVQRKLRNGEFENAISLLRAAREVWPENDSFGSRNMAPEEEFLALRDIFFADLGENEPVQVIEEQPIYDDNDEEEDDEMNYGECDLKFEDFVKRLANPRIIRTCGLALRAFESNSVNTNHCIVKLLHRIALDCKMYVMVFQVSIFRTFQKIYANKDLPQYSELVKFATYIIRQFVNVSETNKKVFIEALFWTTPGEAYEIQFGYNANPQSKAMARAWTEEQEDELRRLFMEHQQNQMEEDVVDWIVNNLIDNTRTRRGVLKKLKEMHLLIDYKGNRKSGVKLSQPWNDEEEEQLRELFEEFQNAMDPVGCIMSRLDVTRARKSIVQKLLALGVIRDAKEVRKKRRARSAASESRDNGGDSGTDMPTSDDEGGGSSPAPRKQKAKPKSPISYGNVARILLSLGSELNEALQWLKDCFSDAVEDLEGGESCEGIPLVPIMDYAVNAMENTDFQRTLKALGVCEPSDEQESYWRIPGDLALGDLNKNMEVIERALHNTLTVEEEQQSTVLEDEETQSTTNDAETRNLVDKGRNKGNNSSRNVPEDSDSESDGSSPRRGVRDSDEESRTTSGSQKRTRNSVNEEKNGNRKSSETRRVLDGEELVNRKRIRNLIDSDEDELITPVERNAGNNSSRNVPGDSDSESNGSSSRRDEESRATSGSQKRTRNPFDEEEKNGIRESSETRRVLDSDEEENAQDDNSTELVNRKKTRNLIYSDEEEVETPVERNTGNNSSRNVSDSESNGSSPSRGVLDSHKGSQSRVVTQKRTRNSIDEEKGDNGKSSETRRVLDSEEEENEGRTVSETQRSVASTQDDDFTKLINQKRARNVIDSDEEEEDGDAVKKNKGNSRSKYDLDNSDSEKENEIINDDNSRARRIVDSEEEENSEDLRAKRTRNESDSEGEMPVVKRTKNSKFVLSDDEDD